MDLINYTFVPHPDPLFKRRFERLRKHYTRPPNPPSLGGNSPKFWISPPKLGGLGGRMQGVQKESDLCVH
jgi:hypothetical protein